MELTAGARLTERRGRGDRLERREAKGKTYFGLRGRRGQWAGWARGRVGRKVGRTENKEKGIFELKIRFFFTKALENYRRRFRRNFDMRIFPKFF
jgi:hypothetical protein